MRIGKDQFPVRLPQGWTLEVLTTQLDAPRMLTFGPAGDLFIGSHSGHVYRLAPPYTRPTVLARVRGYPHSVAFRDGEILIATTDGLYRAPYQPGQERIAAEALSLLASLPGGGGHSSRTVRVGPEGDIYLSLGLAGNCSNQYLGDDYTFQDRRGGILLLVEDAQGAHWETYASGLRNPVGFDWQPRTGVLYASNNGPDHWGFDLPPEYFTALQRGSFSGMPWFQFTGTELKRDRCISTPSPRPAADVTLPATTFPARSAPMGVAFVPPGALDPAFEGAAVVALHGSWATRPAGTAYGDPATRRPPKLVAVRFDGPSARGAVDLVTGFQSGDGDRWARPVGVAIGPDGALYFTSDAGINGLFRVRAGDRSSSADAGGSQ